jgi:site-specific DNA-methyltransferase (adenine-specific)
MNNFISEVTNEDCMEGMARYPDKYFDLAIVDPPYGIGEDGSKNYTRGKLGIAKNYKSFAGNDISAPDINYFNELLRVSKNQIVWGANHFINNIPYNSSCWIVWDKDNGENDFADAELAYTSFKSAVRIFKFRWNGMLQQNMRNKEQRIHPTQKPVALYKWLLQNYAKQGDKILDTHLGSGSSRIAAYEMGFDFTAFELDKEYFDAQEKRYMAHIAQLKLDLL